MESRNSLRQWAHRTFLVSAPNTLLGDQLSQDSGGREFRETVLKCPNSSYAVTTAKTTSEANKSHRVIRTGLVHHCRDREALSTRSLISSGITPTSNASSSIRRKYDGRIVEHDSGQNRSGIDRAHDQSSLPGGPVCSTHNYRTLITDVSKLASRCQRDGESRLNTASLRQVESLHPPRPQQRQRQSLDSNSFISDDTDSGYASLLSSETGKPVAVSKSHSKLQTSSRTLKSPLTRGSGSFSAVCKPSRTEKLKELNESIRKRNARSVYREQRKSATDKHPPVISKSSSLGSSGTKPWRKLRLAVRSAPVCHRKMDNSSSDSWEEFEALGMPRHEDTDYDRGQTTTRPSPRSMANITSSREHERILNEMKFSGSSSYSRDGALKKSIMAIATGIKIMNSKNGEQSHLSPRSKETSKSPDVEMVVEDDENVKLDEEKNDEFEAVSNIRSRGWRIVKVRLSEIAAKAPKNGIDSTPITFRNIAQLVKAKEFRMMLKRRASFIENGRFQFEEAKQDLYARYKVDPHLVSKLANRSRENRNADSNGGDGGQSKTSDDKKK